MSEVGEPTSREVLIALNAHIESDRFMAKINIGFMGSVLLVLVGFAGYSYTNGETLAAQLMAARLAQAQAVQQLPAKTADAVAAKLPVSP